MSHTIIIKSLIQLYIQANNSIQSYTINTIYDESYSILDDNFETLDKLQSKNGISLLESLHKKIKKA